MNTDDSNKKKPSSEKKKAEPTGKINKNDAVENFYDYAQSHTREMLAYVLMIVGIVWSFFNAFYGGILIGLIAGFYFSREIIRELRALALHLEEQGIARSVVLAGTLLVLFIRSPGIFFGLAIGVAVTELIMKGVPPKSEE